jgi:hypothetical protein
MESTSLASTMRVSMPAKGVGDNRGCRGEERGESKVLMGLLPKSAVLMVSHRPPLLRLSKKRRSSRALL